MSAAPQLHYTFAEYLAFERGAGVKHEFLRGLILGMAGGSPEHGARAVRITAALATQLRGRPCSVYDSDVRVRVRAAGLSAYPDASVVCGRLETDGEDKDAIVNPVVLVEVLSPSTAEYDRGEKLDSYRQIESAREIVLVGHESRRIDVWRRAPDGWTSITSGPGETVELESIGVRFTVDEVYDDAFG